uniref:ABC transporter permease n=1 Tax=Ignisphaera aggregans TaxID=334771 RepID=A0A7C4NP28_9CREN
MMINPKLSKLKNNMMVFIRICFSRPSYAFSFVVILLYIIGGLAVVAGLIPPLPPGKGGWENIYAPPSFENFPWYILGRDFAGKPLFLAIVRAIPSTFAVALIAAFITVGLGVVVGMIGGYLGGKVDAVLWILTNVALSIPSGFLALILAIILPTDLKGNVAIMGLILSITAWASLARSIRAQILSLKKREFIDVARVVGFSPWKIMFDELIRITAPFIAVNFMFAITSAIYNYTGLAYLGLLPLTSENWGIQINMAVAVGGALFSDRAILALWSPAIAIILLQYSLLNMARAIEEYINPALRIARAR